MADIALTNLKNSINSESYFSLDTLYKYKDDVFSDKTINLERIFLKAVREDTRKANEIVQLCLDKGANPNDTSIGMTLESLDHHSEILLNHLSNPMNVDIFLNKVDKLPIDEYDYTLEKFLPSDNKIKLQGKLMQLALDKGANPNDNNLYTMFDHEIFLNHPTNPINPDIFLNKVDQLPIEEYNYTLEKYLPNESKIKLQGKLIQLALDKGANPNDNNLYISFDNMVNHYEIFLNHSSNPMNYDIVLNTVSKISIEEYDDTLEKFLASENKIKLQGKLIQLALDKGVNPNDKDLSISIEFLTYNSEILLNHPTNPMNPDIFLDKVSKISIEEDDHTLKKSLPSESKIKQQGNLIQLALDKGADFNKLTYLDHDFLYNHQDLLLSNTYNLTSVFIKHSLRPLQENEKKLHTEDQITHKSILLEQVYKSSQNSLSLESQESIEIEVVQKLLKNNIIDKHTMLKLALKISTINYSEGNEQHDMIAVKAQYNVLEELLKEEDIESLSFKELNIERNNISILKLLINKGLDPNALMIHDEELPDFYEVLNLAIEHKAQITTFDLITAAHGDLTLEVYKLIFSNLKTNLNDKLTPQRIIDEYINRGLKFKEYFDDKTKDIAIESVIQDMLSKGGSLLHMIIKSNQIEIISYVLENLEYDINITNDKGQTPLFLARRPEVADLLITHNADLSIVDKKGDIWVNNPSLEIIEYAVDNNYLPKNYAEKVAIQHFSKGNYEHAAKLHSLGFEIQIDPISEMVASIINGLDNSIENNKYQAILNLVSKAGISIPIKFDHLVNSYDDSHKEQEFDFLNGLLHKLAKHYINLSKSDLEKKLGKSEELDNAYKRLDFKELKIIHPNDIELSNINNSFDSYYQVLGKALNKLDNDFSLEALNINGLRPDPLKEEVTVFRGMKVNLDEDDINSYFKYGHRGFSAGDYQKTLGFYVDQPWSSVGGKWEYGGTYSSVEAVWAAHFADGITSILEADSILMEIRLPQNSPKICGSWKHEYELVPSSINGENIIAIYNLDIYSNNDGKHYQIDEATKNPYIDNNITPKYKENDKIKSDPESIKLYNSLGCKDLPTVSDINKSAKYTDEKDFMKRFTDEIYASDREKLIQDYFAGRESYTEEFSFRTIGECDLAIECCA